MNATAMRTMHGQNGFRTFGHPPKRECDLLDQHYEAIRSEMEELLPTAKRLGGAGNSLVLPSFQQLLLQFAQVFRVLMLYRKILTQGVGGTLELDQREPVQQWYQRGP